MRNVCAWLKHLALVTKRKEKGKKKIVTLCLYQRGFCTNSIHGYVLSVFWSSNGATL